jgi:hypothetical protein
MTWMNIGAVAAVVVATLATAGSASAGGSHRECRWSDYQGYHRHIGANDRAISCDEQVQKRRYGHRRDGKRRLYVEQPYGYDVYSSGGYGGGYSGGSSCTRDWHCERTGLFGLDKYCYWRKVCD